MSRSGFASKSSSEQRSASFARLIYDDTEGGSVLSREKSKRRQEFSLSRESHKTESTIRKGSKFLCFWLPRFNTFSPKFLDKKSF